LKPPVLIVAFLISAVYVISFLAPEAFFQNIPLCPLKFWTGIPCPLCGMSRAFASISHGEFAEAVRYHPLSLLFYPAGIFLVLFLVLDFSLVRRVKINQKSSMPAEGKKIFNPLVILLFLSVLLIVVWIIRYNPFF